MFKLRQYVSRLLTFMLIAATTLMWGCGDKKKVNNDSSQTETTAPVSKLTPTAPKPTKESASFVIGTVPDGLGVRLGTKIPNFAAIDSSNKSITLDELLNKGRILIFFYRGGW